MISNTSTSVKYAQNTTFARWAGVSFGCYLFTIYFGTSLPFQDASADTGDANIFNQLLALLYVISFLSLWGKQDEVFAIIRREKFLSMLMIWALFSVFWSSQGIVSLKRWIGFFGEIIICLAALVHFRWSEVALRYFKAVLCLYLPLTILSVLFIHEAVQWEFPAWRGLEITKNNLGQVAVFSTVILFSVIGFHTEVKHNTLHYILLGCALACLIGARSTTSMLIALFLLALFLTQKAGVVLKHKLVVRFYIVALLATSGAIVTIVYVFSPELIGSFFGFFGKDLTFTGRVDLWAAILQMTEGRSLFGWGIGGFWIMDASHLAPVFEQFVWMPNQAHQGYIDVYNQLGVVGISLLLAGIGWYFFSLSRLQRKHVWHWVFIGLIILNLQESAFLRPRHFSNFLFIFCYLALFTDAVKESRLLKNETQHF